MNTCTSSVADRLTSLRDLFSKWAVAGVPSGVDYPKSLNQARNWSNESLGIVKVGSKRDFTTTHPVYGAAVREINALIKKLGPPKNISPRVYKSQKARRLAAEDESRQYKEMLKQITKQWHETRFALESIQRDLVVERQDSKRLNQENQQLAQSLAKLKRELSNKSNPLRVVE
ncbi:putative Zn-dependent protease [Phyllobacterium trifolii]|uniref:Putative Zn-dependent protease n=1 Tax=Phyllobacterium trifolii TaxID=300193 RepID=A0A839UB88_9HYPH|nr:hypothetical protein [Phyllobacterium trifolii]MBB3147204.1 putative Zn-dependent protease [Phyllobacterium trifolii]